MTEPVSRETPPAPPGAQDLFGSGLPGVARFAELLTTEGVLRGLLGPREAPRIWPRHLVNCALLADAIPADAEVADIGSGAGLPGIVLALHRPDLTVTLVEPLARRIAFLELAVADLGLGDVEIVCARAEELHGRRTFSVVVSRAVAPLGRLAQWCLPLVRPEGVMLAMKGSRAAEELAAHRGQLDALGAGVAEVCTYSRPLVDFPTTLVRIQRPPAGRKGDSHSIHRFVHRSGGAHRHPRLPGSFRST